MVPFFLNIMAPHCRLKSVLLNRTQNARLAGVSGTSNLRTSTRLLLIGKGGDFFLFQRTTELLIEHYDNYNYIHDPTLDPLSCSRMICSWCLLRPMAIFNLSSFMPPSLRNTPFLRKLANALSNISNLLCRRERLFLR